MTEYNRKVVPFRRSKGFMRQRALELMGKEDWAGALQLLRQAGQEDPSDRDIRLETSHVLSLIGCHKESARLLLDLSADDPEDPTPLLPLSRERCRLGDTDGARRTLDLYRLLSEKKGKGTGDNDAEFEVEDEIFNAGEHEWDRRDHVAARVGKRAVACLGSGDAERAVNLFARCIVLSPLVISFRAFYALALAMAGHHERAERQCAILKGEEELDAECLVLLSRAYRVIQKDAAADEMIARAFSAAIDKREWKLLLFSCADNDDADRTLRAAERALSLDPCDPALLHACAAATLRATGDFARAHRKWVQLADILPDDSRAKYYLALDAIEDPLCVPYTLQVPQSEILHRLNYIAGNAESDPGRFREKWNDDETLREYLIWALTLANPPVRQLVLSQLVMADDPAVLSRLRLEMVDPAVTPQEKVFICSMRSLSHSDVFSLLPPDTDTAATLLPAGEELLSALPADQRRIVRYAESFLNDFFDLSALPALAALWTNYISSGGPLLIRTETAGAALAFQYLSMRDSSADIGRTAALFGVSIRQMEYYYHLLKRRMPHGGPDNDKTDRL